MRNIFFLKSLLILLLFGCTLQQLSSPWIKKKDPDPPLLPPPEYIKQTTSTPKKTDPTPVIERPPELIQNFPTYTTPGLTGNGNGGGTWNENGNGKNPKEPSPENPAKIFIMEIAGVILLFFCVWGIILKCHRGCLNICKYFSSSGQERDDINESLRCNENRERRYNALADSFCLKFLHALHGMEASERMQRAAVQIP